MTQENALNILKTGGNVFLSGEPGSGKTHLINQDVQAFGGLQVILVGDFFQLPPVVKREEPDPQKTFDDIDGRVKCFAYDASCWQKADFITCYLTEQHRQEDEDFLSVLSAIRRNEYDETHHAHIEKRKVMGKNVPNGIPRLFSHN